MTLGSPEQPFPTPEARIFGAVFRIKPTQLPPEIEKLREETVREALKVLGPRQRSVVVNHFMHEQAPQGTAKNHEAQALSELKTDPNLTLFLPYEPNQLGAKLWGVGYGYELLALLSPLDIRALRIGSLHFSDQTAKEIGEHFLYKKGGYTKIKAARLLGGDVNRYSKDAQDGIKQAFTTLQANR